MIPLRDENPSGRTPHLTRLIILINALVFVYELSLGPALQEFALAFGIVPAHVSNALAGRGNLVTDALVPLFTSMFLHGGWLHLISNMWYLWIFGDNIEDQFGHLGFVLFYLGAGLASGLLHFAMQTGSPIPTVGASGAIAGVLGAYVVLFPRARVITLVPLFVFIQLMALPAVVVLGLWFVTQFFNGALSLLYTSDSGGGVAWWGHIGGFAFGVLVALVARGRVRAAARRSSFELRP
ncbi:MAG: rhomboid family intramembrane serine protease [Candidatus Eisenbacteria bacterium]|uniref:Rhomboid family intramembrane serine protease n=1 Tax=Eiseniibacteriota bacterium TaxID=2212470 RepID=A0A849SWI9_UNCEI|nr:rhomboid family intramembrane serine protease [Candidatus Eisenbacteria bacterium]